MECVKLLTTDGMYNKIIEFYEIADQHYRYPEYMQQSRMYKLFKCHYGKALIKKGQFAKAKSIFDSVGNIYFPENGRIFWSADFYLSRVEYLIIKQNYPEALEIMEELIEDSQSLKFDFYKNQAQYNKERIEKLLEIN